MDNPKSLIQWLTILNRQRQIIRSHFPWWQKKRHQVSGHLLIGLPQSGKSSLLHASQATGILDKDTNFQAWQHEHRLTIEINAEQLALLSKKYQRTWRIFWLRRVLKKFIKNCIICIDYQRLGNLTDQQHQFKTLSSALEKLHTILGEHKPTLFVVCKSDLMIGFNEYHMDLDRQEHREAWGFELSDSKSIGFDQSFKKFLHATQSKLIQRLQHCFDQTTKELVIDFPLQLESIRQILSQQVTSLNVSLAPTACYFTSSTQQGDLNDRLYLPFRQDFSVAPLQQPATLLNVKRPIFVHQLICQIVPQFPSLNYRDTWLKRVGLNLTMITAALAFITILMLCFNQSFNEFKTVKQLQHQLVSFLIAKPASEQTGFETALASLNSLHDSVNDDFITKEHSLNRHATHIYHAALQIQLLPKISQHLEKELSKQGQEPTYQYQALRAYLMLDQTDHKNSQEFMQWLNRFVEADKSLSVLQKQQLRTYTHALLQSDFTAQQLNQTVITTVRKRLASTQGDMLGIILLQSEAADSTKQTPQSTDLLGEFLKAPDNWQTIPPRYQFSFFSHILTKLPKIAHEAEHGNWVIGKLPKQISQHELLTQLEQFYITDAALWWRNYIHQIKAKHPHNLQQAYELLSRLAKPGQLPKLLKQLTHKLSDYKKIPLPLQPLLKFTTLSENKLDHLSTALTDAAHTISQLIHAPSVTKASLNSALDRAHDKKNAITDLIKLADQYPEPLQSWVKTWSSMSWQLVLNRAQEQIEDQWKSSILPYYQNKLLGKYPLFNASEQDIDLANFEYFFSDKGLFQKFFIANVEPFIDSKPMHWKNKEIDGASMHFSQQALDNFSRANIIKEMLFNEQGKLAFQFDLQAKAMHPSLQQVNLKYGNLNLVDINRTQLLTHTISWPVDNPQLKLSLIKQRSPTLLITEGPWSLFRLFDQAFIKSGSQPNRYLITFQHDSDFVNYYVTTDHLINPLMSGIIDNFRCTNELG